MSIIEIPDRLDSVHGLYLTRMILRTRLTVTKPNSTIQCMSIRYHDSARRDCRYPTNNLMSIPLCLSAMPLPREWRWRRRYVHSRQSTMDTAAARASSLIAPATNGLDLSSSSLAFILSENTYILDLRSLRLAQEQL